MCTLRKLVSTVFELLTLKQNERLTLIDCYTNDEAVMLIKALFSHLWS